MQIIYSLMILSNGIWYEQGIWPDADTCGQNLAAVERAWRPQLGDEFSVHCVPKEIEIEGEPA